MTSALVIGGTGFVGRHTAKEFSEHGYKVTTVARSREPDHGFPDVEHVSMDRTEPGVHTELRKQVGPDVVVDCAGYQPSDVRDAVEVFRDVEAYVYVSSGGVYSAHEIPKREDETPLHSYEAGVEGDMSLETYGARKAECDRIVRNAAGEGVNASCIRPTMIYGPASVDWGGGTTGSGGFRESWAEVSGLQTHHDYWVDRVRRYDRVVVPGDGTAIWHRAYVEDVASAIHTVVEEGEAGKAYNVADRRVCTLEDVIELIAGALDTSVDVVHASRRELGEYGLVPDDFVLYHHLNSSYPHVLSSCKLSSLGWGSTPVETAIQRTVEESVESGRRGGFYDPGRNAEERLIDDLVDA